VAHNNRTVGIAHYPDPLAHGSDSVQPVRSWSVDGVAGLLSRLVSSGTKPAQEYRYPAFYSYPAASGMAPHRGTARRPVEPHRTGTTAGPPCPCHALSVNDFGDGVWLSHLHRRRPRHRGIRPVQRPRHPPWHRQAGGYCRCHSPLAGRDTDQSGGAACRCCCQTSFFRPGPDINTHARPVIHQHQQQEEKQP